MSVDKGAERDIISKLAVWGLVGLAGLCTLGWMMGDSRPPDPLQQRSTGDVRLQASKIRELARAAAKGGDRELAHRAYAVADAFDDGEVSRGDTQAYHDLIIELRDRGLVDVGHVDRS